MSKQTLYNDLVTQLTAQAPSLNTIALFKNDFEHGLTVTYPCCLIEFKEANWEDLEIGLQSGRYTITMHIGFDGITTTDGAIHSVIDEVYGALQLFEEDYFTPLTRRVERLNVEHQNIISWEADYSTVLIDSAANTQQYLVSANADLSVIKGLNGGFDSEYSYEMDGDNDYLNLGMPSEITNIVSGNTPTFTISTLLKRGVIDKQETIFSRYRSSGAGRSFQFLFRSDNLFQVRVFTDATSANYRYVVANTYWTSTTDWLFLQMVYDGNASGDSKIRIYINGMEYSTEYGATIFGGTDPEFANVFNSDSDARIGGNYVANQSFTGLINHMAMWDVALSAGQIKAMYNVGAPLSPLNVAINHLAAYWKFDNDEWDGTNYGVINTQSPSSHSMEFNDTLGYAHIGAQTIERTDPFSFVFFFKRDVVTDTANNTLISNIYNNKGIWIYIDTTDRLVVRLANSATNTLNRYTSNQVCNSLDKWCHVVVSYDGSSVAAGLKIFVNGVNEPLVGTDVAVTDSILSTEIMELGATWLTNNRLKAQMNHVGWFDWALGQSEATALYHKGYGRQPNYVSGCIGQWLAEDATYNGSEYDWPDSAGSNDAVTVTYSGTEKRVMSPFSGTSVNIDQVDKKLGSPESN